MVKTMNQHVENEAKEKLELYGAHFKVKQEDTDRAMQRFSKHSQFMVE